MTNQAVSKMEQGQEVAAPISESAAILSMVERASRDPSVDLDKMERLMRMHREVKAEAAEEAFNQSMRAAQAEMRRITANATNTQTKSKYATFDQIDRELRPIYTKHGFSVSFDEGDTDKPEHIRIVCYVSHEAGHTRTYRKDMPADGKGAKGGDVMTKTHAAGAAAAYGARYLMKGIFNIAVGEDDRDGNTPAELISEEQATKLRKLMSDLDRDEAKFLQFAKLERLEDMYASKYDAAVQAINAAAAKARNVGGQP